jgi:hypothetical protein
MRGEDSTNKQVSNLVASRRIYVKVHKIFFSILALHKFVLMGCWHSWETTWWPCSLLVTRPRRLFLHGQPTIFLRWDFSSHLIFCFHVSLRFRLRSCVHSTILHVSCVLSNLNKVIYSVLYDIVDIVCLHRIIPTRALTKLLFGTQNPDMIAKAQAEIDSVLRGRRPTLEDVKNLQLVFWPRLLLSFFLTVFNHELTVCSFKKRVTQLREYRFRLFCGIM